MCPVFESCIFLIILHLVFFSGGNAFLGKLGGRGFRKGGDFLFLEKIVVKMSISNFLLIQPVALVPSGVFQVFCII